MINTTKNSPKKGLRFVLKNLYLDGTVQEVSAFSNTPPSKSSSRRSLARFDALIRTLFCSIRVDIRPTPVYHDQGLLYVCLWEELVPRSAIKATLGKWGSYGIN